MRSISLKSKLAAAFFLTALLPFLILGLINYDITKENLIEKELKHAQVLHSNAKVSLKKLFLNSLEKMSDLKSNKNLKAKFSQLLVSFNSLDNDDLTLKEGKKIRKSLIEEFEKSKVGKGDTPSLVIKNLSQLDQKTTLVLASFLLKRKVDSYLMRDYKLNFKSVEDTLKEKYSVLEYPSVYAISNTGNVFYSSEKRLDLSQNIRDLKLIAPSLYNAFEMSRKSESIHHISKWDKNQYNKNEYSSYITINYPDEGFSLFFEINGIYLYSLINQNDDKHSESYLLDSKFGLISKSILNQVSESSPIQEGPFIKNTEVGSNVVENKSNITVFREVSPITILNDKLYLVTESNYNKVSIAVKKYRDRFLVFSVVLMVVSILMGTLFGGVLSKSVLKFVKGLKKSTDQLKNISGEIEHASQKLSETTTEQGAAIETTVINLDQMTAMLTQTEVNVRQTIDMTTLSREQSAEATFALDAMLEAMEEIEGSNIKLAEIETLMDKIHEKTEIINEIVAETRLLSFNASIEAARAGNNGKGFAVVAEEIGKLASMSGNAAEEITNLIDSSTTQVKQVVSLNKDKVTQGKETSKDCELVFKHLNNSLLNISKAIDKINMASMEQSTGIQHTNKAMVEMETITQQNSDNAGLLTSKAGVLYSESESFKKVIEELNLFVAGGKKVSFKSRFKLRSKDQLEEKAEYEKQDIPTLEESSDIEKTVDRDDDKWKAS